jgi:hypothetical protein
MPVFIAKSVVVSPTLPENFLESSQQFLFVWRADVSTMSSYSLLQGLETN